MAGVLGPTPVIRLAMPKLALDHPRRVLDLGRDTGLEFLMTKSPANHLRLPASKALRFDAPKPTNLLH
jgi:hypothetical protein